MILFVSCWSQITHIFSCGKTGLFGSRLLYCCSVMRIVSTKELTQSQWCRHTWVVFQVMCQFNEDWNLPPAASQTQLFSSKDGVWQWQLLLHYFFWTFEISDYIKKMSTRISITHLHLKIWDCITHFTLIPPGRSHLAQIPSRHQDLFSVLP